MLLSDRGIKRLMQEGCLRIEPFKELRLGPMSYDLALDNLYERRWDKEVKDGMPFEEFLVDCCVPLDGIDLEGGKYYFGTSMETITKSPEIPRIDVATRSSLARHGVEVVADTEFLSRDGRVPFIIKTHNTRVRAPQFYPMAQLVFKTGLPLDEAEITAALSSGEIHISGDHKIIRENQIFPKLSFGYMPSAASLLLHLGSGLKRYKGGVMDVSQDSSKHFEDIDIRHGYILSPGEFYLGFTEEEVSFSTRYAGRLVRLFRDFGSTVHTNAPWIQPGSGRKQEVLEMSVAEPRMVKAGMPVCRLEVYRLDEEPEKSYASVGRYVDQNGPATSRSHLDFR